MAKKFLIAGCIVDTDVERETFEDVTPSQLNSFLKSLEDGEEAEIDITSYGGSVTAGLAMIDLLKRAEADGHKITTHVIGIAASMASAIACAGSALKIDNTAFLMVHLPWTITSGNSIDLRKEADTLDMYRDALISVYLTKFHVTREQMQQMLEAETWIIGAGATMYELDAEIVEVGEPLRAAAFSKNMPKFLHTPRALKELIMSKQEEIKQADDVQAEDKTVVENQAEETVVEDSTVEEPKDETSAEIKAEDEEPAETADETPKADAEKMITKAEADKRVFGMQSTMAKKLDALKKEYDAKINDFENQLKVKDEELAKVNANAISLSKDLESAKAINAELSEKTSALEKALEEKNNALATLNASVLQPNMNVTNWRTLKGQAFFDYLKAHPEIKK